MKRITQSALALLGLAALAAPAAAQKREVGNLVLDGIPEIPASVADRLQQYQNVRSAAFLDWDPAGTGILVATRFGDTNQVHRVSKPDGDRQQLTFFKDAVTSAFFDPADKSGSFTYSLAEGGNEFYQFYRLDAASGKWTLLTDGKSRNESAVAANKGARFAYASTRRNGKDFDIYVQSFTDPTGAKMVYQASGQWNAADWSADDKRLLVYNFISINEAYLHVLDPETGKLTPVNAQEGKKIGYGDAVFARHRDGVYYTSDEDGEFLALTFYDLETGKKTLLRPDLKWDVKSIAVSTDGKRIAYTTNENGASALYLGSTGSPGKATRIKLPVGVISGNLAFDAAGKRVAFSMSTADSSADVYSVDGASKVTRWTRSEVGGLNRSRFVAPELIEYKTFDGKMIPAWIYRPRDAKGPVPVIVDIHGGPEGQTTARFDGAAQYYALELGIATILPNVRGSTGYGKSYTLLDNAEKREDSVKDIGALLDWIATQKDLDAKRVAVTGGSYGGYMVLASLTHYSDRLRCGIDVVGISNFVTFLENTQEYRRDLRRAEYGDERDPRMRELMTKISPTTNAAKIKVPLFVAQGLNDPRVPASEAEQIVATVRKSKQPVWYLLAKDEGHGFAKKSNRDAYTAAASLFFEKFLLGK